MQAAIRASDIFKSLGNTAAAWYFAAKAISYHDGFDGDNPFISVLLHQIDAVTMEAWRHPDPRLVDKWDVTRPELQMRGV